MTTETPNKDEVTKALEQFGNGQPVAPRKDSQPIIIVNQDILKRLNNVTKEKEEE